MNKRLKVTKKKRYLRVAFFISMVYNKNMKLKRFFGWGCLALLSVFVVLGAMFLPSVNQALAYSGNQYSECLEQAVHSDETGLSEAVASKISSLATTCAVCNNQYTYGAMWINDFAGTNLSGGTLDPRVYNHQVWSPVESTDHIAIGYLHGQAYACGQSISGSSMEANHIYFLTHAVNNDGTQNHSEHSASSVLNSQVDYIVNANAIANSILDRSQGPVAKGYWTKPNGTLEVKIDIDKFINGAEDGGYSEQCQNEVCIGYTVYKKTVHIYRCPYGEASHAIGDRQCWSDATDIYLQVSERIVPPTPPEPTTCPEKHQNDSDYSKTESIPGWFNGSTSYSFNKCSGTSILGTRLRVNNSTKAVRRSNGNNEGGSIIYVKPGDQVAFDHMFLSAAQPVTKTIIDEGYTSVWTGKPANQWSNYHRVSATVSSRSDAYTWTDGKPIGTVDNFNLTVNYNFERGHTGAPSGSGSNYTVNTGNLVTMTNDGSRTNLGSATIGDLKIEGVSGVSGTVTSATLQVAAPYNFANKITVKWAAADSGSQVYAGDIASSIGGQYTTEAVYNSEVAATYATVSPSSKLRLYTYYSDSNETGTTVGGSSTVSSFNCSNRGCEQAYSADNQRLNSSEKTNGDTGNFVSGSIKVADTNAGRWLCAIATIYPATSGAATNYSNANGSDTWYVSPSKCVQIAKKPTFQVWNGNLYANGAVRSNVSTKSTVAGHSEITSTDPRSFGSWVEHGLIVRGTNDNLASGAVFGYQTNSNGNLSNNPGGHAEGIAPAVCKRSPLTVANSGCVNHPGTTTNGSSGIVVTETVNFDDYKSTATQATSLATNTNVTLSSSDKYKDVSGVRYFYNSSVSGKLYLSADTIPAGANYVVYSKGSVYINGNLTYEDTNYNVPSEVPQLIIITDGSVFIDGNVTRVDAWLVAKSSESNKGLINTCATSDGTQQTEATCSKQLRINGPIIARQLELTRVYGSATGNNSATPAEIINLSPATYVFSQSKATEGATLRTVYSKEVAPRW